MQHKSLFLVGVGALLLVGTVLIFTMTPQAPAEPVATNPTSSTPVVDPAPAPQPVTVPTVAPTTQKDIKPTPTPIPTPAPVKTPPVTATPIVASVHAVIIKDYSFAPATITVKKGTTVTWTNEDIAKHTVTGDQGGPSSEFFGKGQSYSYTFDKAGTYPYHCEPHPYMTATIIVTE